MAAVAPHRAPSVRCAAVLAAAVVAALTAAGPASAIPSIASKRAEAARVLAQVQEIDAQLSHVIDAYNAAEIRLEEIRADQRRNRRYLAIARANFTRAEAALEQRVVALYEAGEADLLGILLGASSLDEVLDRVDAVTRVSAEDSRIVREVRAFRAEMNRRKRALARARAEQEQVVAERAAQRREIGRRLAERRELLASIENEITRLEAAEAERQRQLRAQAQARLAQQSSASEDAPQAEATAQPAAEAEASAPSPEGASSPPPARHGGVVAIAMRYLGVPYRWGGASPSTGFDCSGFVMYVYAQVGVSLPHNAAMQYSYGSPVAKSQLQPGDLVFFNGLGHNGIYIGGGQFIHSPHTGDVVKISSLSDSWYASTWVGGKRL